MKNENANHHELQQHYEKYNAILQNLTIMSDVFMRNVFKQWECTEYVLQVSGLMDMNTLNAGQDFSGLPESYVIFITRD